MPLYDIDEQGMLQSNRFLLLLRVYERFMRMCTMNRVDIFFQSLVDTIHMEF